MLVLTRRVGEVVFINDNITVEVLGIEQGKVRLGFRAPPDVTIHREEVRQRIHAALTEPIVPTTRAAS